MQAVQIISLDNDLDHNLHLGVPAALKVSLLFSSAGLNTFRYFQIEILMA